MISSETIHLQANLLLAWNILAQLISRLVWASVGCLLMAGLTLLWGRSTTGLKSVTNAFLISAMTKIQSSDWNARKRLLGIWCGVWTKVSQQGLTIRQTNINEHQPIFRIVSVEIIVCPRNTKGLVLATQHLTRRYSNDFSTYCDGPRISITLALSRIKGYARANAHGFDNEQSKQKHWL